MAVDIAQLGFRIESLEAELAAQRLDKMSRAANDAETASQRLAKQADKVGRSMQKVGRSMSMYVTAPLVAVGVAAVKTFADFDDALTQSLAIMGDVSDTMRNDMVAAARKMGRETAFSATQAAESFYFLASAGLSAEASVAALPTVAAFAQAGMFDMARATDILTDAQSALGMTLKDPIENMEEMKRVSDVLVKANTIANASVEQFGIALTNKAGTAMKQYNIDVEEGVAVLAAWADQGIKAEEAGEKFNIVTRDLQTAVRKNADEFRNYGIAVYDSQGGLRNMADIIGDLERALGPMSIEQQAATLALLGFQDRSVIAIRSLIGLSDNIRKYEDSLRSAAGTTREVADKQMQSFSKQLGLAKAEIADVAIEIGGTLAPHVMSAAQTIRDFAGSFRELNPETQKTIIKVGLFVAAMGPALIVLGSMTRILALLLPYMVRFAVLIYTRVIPALVAWAAAMGGTMGIVYLINLAAIALGSIALAMRDTTRAATELDIEIQQLIDSVETFGMTQFEVAIGKVNQLIIENDAATQQAQANLQMLIELQQRGGGDQAGDRLARQIVDASEKIVALEAEGQRLEEQLQDLSKAQDELTFKTQLASGVLDEITVTAERREAQISETVSLTKSETKALQALIDELKPAEKELRKLAKARALLTKALKSGDLSPEAYEELNKLLNELIPTFNALTDTMGEFREMNADIAAELEDSFAYIQELTFEKQIDEMQELHDALAGGEEAWREYQRAMFQAQAVAELGPEATEAQIKAVEELAGAIFDLQNPIEGMGDTFESVTREWMGSLRELQGLFHEDSAEAEALRTTMILLNVVMGIHAVIKQLAEGDVYSAIPRALTVAALIASMGVSTGASGGGSSSRSLQESQGTGTVLGDAEAKTESIVRATEITADATSELVGINRGMLNALLALQGGTAGASTLIARGADPMQDFQLPSGELNSIVKMVLLGGPLGVLLDNLLGGFLGRLLDKIFGGKSKVLDEGIRIIGGELGVLMTEVFAQAFLKYKRKKHIFDDYDEYWQFQELPEDVGRQFALVFGAIYDTVFEAAVALGMSAEEVETALLAFEIGDIDISLMDLTGEEVEEELLAVFGGIFDNLAGAIVPWIGQFQQVGEGLGETLVRVATSVQIFQEAMNAFGFAIDEMDPEVFAQIAVELVEMVGGVDEFIDQFSSFFDTFASDAEKLDFVTDQFSRAMESVGLAIPQTRDGMWELMQSLDATTEEGRAQIAMLLELADVADEYYDLMEKGTEELVQQAEDFAAQISGFLGIGYQPLQQLTDEFINAMKAAASLGASQREYAMIVRKFDLELKRMAASLQISILRMTQELFGGSLFDTASPAEPIVRGLNEVREVANPLFDDWINALKSIRGYVDDLKIDDTYSTLTPAQRLEEAQRQFNDLLRRAQGGDVEAAAALPEAARNLLEDARFMFASGQQYTDIYNAVIAGMESVEMPSDVAPTITEEVTTGDTLIADAVLTGTDAIIQALERYLLAVDLATALKDLATVLDTSVVSLAQELGVPLGQLAEILGVQLDPMDNNTAAAIGEMAMLLGANVFELIEALGISLMDLAATLGISVDNMSQQLATQLGEFATLLGANVFDLAEQMGVSISDLALTFGVSIAEFSADQFAGLILFADALGVSMTELGVALGLQLGSIADETSLISEGFDEAVDQLPPETGDELQPYLDAIRDAADPTEREIALQNLGNFILGLPPEIAAPLIPFLEAMGFHHIEPQLKAILEIAATNSGILGWQSAIVAAIQAIDMPDIDININIDLGEQSSSNSSKNAINPDGTINPTHYDPLGSYARGGYVPETGMYRLHEGEFVVDKNRDTLMVAGGDEELTAAELKAIREVLTDIREQQRRYQEEQLETSRTMNSNLELQAEQTRRIGNG